MGCKGPLEVDTQGATGKKIRRIFFPYPPPPPGVPPEKKVLHLLGNFFTSRTQGSARLLAPKAP